MARKFSSAEVEVTARDRTKPGIDSAKKSMGGLTSAVKAYGAEIGAAIAAMYGIYRVLKDVTKEYLEQEAAIAEMNQALKATGAYTPTLSRELQDMAGALQGVTVYSDDAIESAIGLLQAFGDLSGEGLKQAIPLMLDFAAATKTGPDEAAKMFGKTLGSNANALSRYGLELKEGMTQLEELGAMQAWVNSHFRDAAKAMGLTTAGQMKIMTNQIGEMKEALGGMVAEILPFWIKQITEGAKALSSFLNAIQGVNKEVDYAKKLMDSMNKEQLQKHIDFLNQEIARHEENAKSLKAESMNMELSRKTREMAKDKIDEEVEALARLKHERNVYNNSLKTFEERQKAANKAQKDGNELTKVAKEYVAGYFPALSSMTDMVRLYRGELAEAAESMGDLNEATVGYFPALQSMSDMVSTYRGELAEVSTAMKPAAEVLAEQKDRFNEIIGAADEMFGVISSASAMSYANQRTDLDEWYFKQREIIDKTITDEEQKRNAIATLDDEMETKARAIQVREAKAKKGFAMFDILIDTARGIAESFPKVWKMAMVAAMGAAQLAIVASQKIPSYAQGGDFVTQGPELMMVGDNPSGRERVSVTPSEKGFSQQATVYLNITFGREIIKREIQALLTDGKLTVPAILIDRT